MLRSLRFALHCLLSLVGKLRLAPTFASTNPSLALRISYTYIFLQILYDNTVKETNLDFRSLNIMSNFEFKYQNGFFSAIEPLTVPSQNTAFGSKNNKPINLLEPSNVFVLQNAVSDNLNKFQTRYSRYVRCQDTNTNTLVNDPPCNVDGTDSLASLNDAYHTLLSSMQDLSGSFPTQYNTNAITPLHHDILVDEIPNDYDSMLKLRQDLDKKLRELQMQFNDSPGTSTKTLESAMFANTLWVILASCLVYYIIVEL